jgi:hypothetical protein
MCAWIVETLSLSREYMVSRENMFVPNTTEYWWKNIYALREIKNNTCSV